MMHSVKQSSFELVSPLDLQEDEALRDLVEFVCRSSVVLSLRQTASSIVVPPPILPQYSSSRAYTYDDEVQ